MMNIRYDEIKMWLLVIGFVILCGCWCSFGNFLVAIAGGMLGPVVGLGYMILTVLAICWGIEKEKNEGISNDKQIMMDWCPLPNVKEKP